MRPVERFFRLSPQHSITNYYELICSSPSGEKIKVKPCEPICSPELVIGLVANNNIKPKRLMVRGRDCKPIQVYIPALENTVQVAHPGKSGFISLSNKAGDPIRSAVETYLDRQPNRRDHVHFANVGNIMNAGWTVFWAPLNEFKLLHVRIVADRTIQSGNLPSLDDASKLAQVFSKLR